MQAQQVKFWPSKQSTGPGGKTKRMKIKQTKLKIQCTGSSPARHRNKTQDTGQRAMHKLRVQHSKEVRMEVHKQGADTLRNWDSLRRQDTKLREQHAGSESKMQAQKAKYRLRKQNAGSEYKHTSLEIEKNRNKCRLRNEMESQKVECRLNRWDANSVSPTRDAGN